MDYSNINQQVKRAPENAIRTFSDQISHLDNLLAFNIGEPDFPTPMNIKQAAIQSIEKDQSFYSHSRGVLELREAISHYLKRKYQLTYSAEEEIIVTAGATEALYLCLTGLLNPGDQVLVVDPSYVIYHSQIVLAGGETIPIDVSESGFKLTPSQLENALATNQRVKALVFNFPTNPTGVTYSREEIEALASVIQAHELFVIADEVYSEFSYESDHVSIASFIPENTLLINGASKSHAMTGWRSAFLAGPAPLLNAFYPLHQAVVTSPTTQVQYASIAAYSEESDQAILDMKQSYQERCELLYAGMEALGFESAKPTGAFYLFTKVPQWFQGDDVAFCLALAQECRIATTPGSVFGNAGKGYFRTSYVSSTENLRLYLERLALFKKQYTA